MLPDLCQKAWRGTRTLAGRLASELCTPHIIAWYLSLSEPGHLSHEEDRSRGCLPDHVEERAVEIEHHWPCILSGPGMSLFLFLPPLPPRHLLINFDIDCLKDFDEERVLPLDHGAEATDKGITKSETLHHFCHIALRLSLEFPERREPRGQAGLIPSFQSRT